jgi:rubrerythrin
MNKESQSLKAIKNRLSLVEKNGSIYSQGGKLRKEWSNKNELASNEVHAKSTNKYWWKCEICSHIWQAQPYNRIFRKSGCPECAKKIVGKKVQERALKNGGSFIENYPELMNEWDFSLNADVDPYSLSRQSGIKVWWRCTSGHSWKTTVASRVAGNNCPKCVLHGTSQIELRVYTEILSIYPDALLKEKIDKQEVDIYIPSINVGIEVDGFNWHKNTQIRDNKKEKILLKKINLIRLRDSRLSKRLNSIVMNENESQKIIINRVIERLSHLDSSKKNEYKNYKESKAFRNNSTFLKLIQRLPKPLEKKSFGDLFPEHLIDWDSSINNGLSPTDIYATSKIIIKWRCHKCGDVYEMPPLQKYQYGSGCPAKSCYKPPSGKSLAEFYPDIADEWDFDKNYPETPQNVYAKTNKEYFWKCRECGTQIFTQPKKRIIYPKKYSCVNENCIKNSVPNSIDKVRADLLQDWDYQANKKINISNVSINSTVLFAWKCRFCGLKRKMKPSHRALVKTVCGTSKCRKDFDLINSHN